MDEYPPDDVAIVWEHEAGATRTLTGRELRALTDPHLWFAAALAQAVHKGADLPRPCLAGYGLAPPANLLERMENDELGVKVGHQLGHQVGVLGVVEGPAEHRYEDLPGMGEHAEMDHPYDDEGAGYRRHQTLGDAAQEIALLDILTP